MKIKRQIQHLWFIKELLQNILTIAVAKVFFLRKHHNLEFAEFELTNFIGAVINHPAIYIYIYIYIYIKQLSGFIFNHAHFPKPGILFRSSECLKLLTRNHYKNI